MDAIVDAICSTLPDDAIVVKDATISAYLWANRIVPVTQTRSSMRPTSQAIGPGLPLAVGAATTGRTTVVVQGDGGLMLSVGELATAAQYDLALILCVFNDRGYGMLRFIQDMAVAGRRTGVELATPDFVALGTAFGVRSAHVATPAEFAAAFSAAVAAGGTWVLDVDITSMAPMVITPQARPVRS